jgi:hypothetical protein
MHGSLRREGGLLPVESWLVRGASCLWRVGEGLVSSDSLADGISTATHGLMTTWRVPW